MSNSARAVVVSTVIDRTPAEVWADVREIASHVDWMQDAAEIRFLTEHREGQGTRFECDTKVGPITLTDVMEITRWVPSQAMGVRHTGVVTGTGEFTLEPEPGGRTRFQWAETLRYPLWLGGPVGAFLSRPVLRWIWRRNLTRLAARF